MSPLSPPRCPRCPLPVPVPLKAAPLRSVADVAAMSPLAEPENPAAAARPCRCLCPDPDRDPDRDWDQNRHQERDPDRDWDQERGKNRDQNRDWDRHQNWDQNPHRDQNRDQNRDMNGHQNGHQIWDQNPHQNWDQNRYRMWDMNRDMNRHQNWDRNWDQNPHQNQNWDLNRDRDVNRDQHQKWDMNRHQNGDQNREKNRDQNWDRHQNRDVEQDRHHPQPRCRCRCLVPALAAIAALAALGAAAAAALGALRGPPPLKAATAAHVLLSAGSLSPSPRWRYQDGVQGVFLSGDIRPDTSGMSLRVTSGGLYLLYGQLGVTCTAASCPQGHVTLQLRRAVSPRPLLAVSLSLPLAAGGHHQRSALAQAVGQLWPGDTLSLELVRDTVGDTAGWQLEQEEREGNFVGLLRIAGG
ncbi:uncharacterized protein LOC132340960 [Haemorhous mexicanus]|uniref:uncharacterized protein LOC132340960 n=1 Tax=Haemorhous mexicanus TaxID=30427 RepID=UPI0028BF257A|nr:uncharacterized protein LOC132340960 [Haemorhous mexicanus]